MNPMITEPKEIFETLKEILTAATPPLKIRINTENNFEVAGTKEAMQGKQKVDGFYFASIVPKPKDVRFYFFPIYMCPSAFENLSEALKKNMKGKSCFHFKKLDTELEKEIREMVNKGVEIFRKENLI
jgi:hypothetical protein